ncbi:Nif3-like dinuclear metal center hexameric protein [Fodinisporobacter ferrooxydans]|uniref:GTP cyclohydrolase 1 type 2 homolog n=1 Tax=Fodinisporobacter ferrooxydans TaxID=2901836 RepID=A0ABY4CIF6_9BACL|nr:Nif3-like dinuclear metal center hexameric protein [Alicyclobacillaceae bacterium MYW30-H2]
MHMAKVADVMRWMNDWAPPALAMDWDRVGLQVGDPNAHVDTLLATLDVTENVVAEAVQKGANMIVAHHALLFQPLKELRLDTEKGRIIQKLLQHGIAVFVAHTNLDIAEGGVNDVLAERLQLQDVRILSRQHNEELLKFVVFVPEEQAEHVRTAICEAGAGWIGNYSHCTFNTAGVGTFVPQTGTDPFIGKQGQLEKVREIRLETIVPRSLQTKIIEACLQAHPYEEVAYDLYPLEVMGKEYGIGRIGVLPKPMTLETFAAWTKQRLESKHLRFVGDKGQQISKVAVLGGAGMDWAKEAKRLGADVFVTGDVKYHEAQDAQTMRLAVIDAGHNATEKWIREKICEELTRRGLQEQTSIRCIASETDTETFQQV